MTEPTDPYGAGWGSQQPGPPPGGYETGYGNQPYGGQYGAPPGYGPPPGWGAPQQYGHYGAPPNEGKAVAGLVCAILAWFACPLVLAIVALVLASQSSNEIRNSGGRLGGDGMNTATRVIAWINIIGSVLFLLFMFVAIGAASTSNPY